MTAPSLSQQSLEQARDVVLRHASVEAAYLLGVAATSRLWSESDVDVAVLARRGTAISVAGRLSSTASLERIFARTVDVGVLGPSNVVYAKEAVVQGQILTKRDHSVRVTLAMYPLSMDATLQEARREVLRAYAA